MAKILLISTLILFFYGLEASPTDEGIYENKHIFKDILYKKYLLF